MLDFRIGQKYCGISGIGNKRDLNLTEGHYGITGHAREFSKYRYLDSQRDLDREITEAGIFVTAPTLDTELGSFLPFFALSFCH